MYTSCYHTADLAIRDKCSDYFRPLSSLLFVNVAFIVSEIPLSLLSKVIFYSSFILVSV